MVDDIKKVNKELAKLMRCDPLPVFEKPTKEDEYEMKVGLAQVYANRGFRMYMSFAINQQKEATLRAENMNDVFYIKGRILTLKELLNKSKTEFEKIQLLKKQNEKINKS